MASPCGGGGGLSCCRQPRAGCQTKKVKHTPQTKIYCGVLQCKSALQPYMLVRVGVGVEMWVA